ncbi:DUF2812 domain-containing protein [Clostridium intestinale]|uniref:DUF2812 domain-containing protein n=1 Tax=Clostridium intestinale TaxID=36845 RepID=A0A7D6VRH5_9CLOT|nr:DUF2812 domain-containing protein [Clostridium intestinale]QLY80289.1 DUF2812 domain-containing protein [Clostridium intestinale]
MRNKKTVYFLYEPYECSALEEYFEAMAESGWLIKSINRPFLKFEKIEPRKLKFSVDILNKISSYDPDDSDDALDYREYCEAAGWKYICQDKKIQVFYTEDYNKAIDIQTDEGEKFKSVVKASLGNVFSYLFIIFIWLFNIKMQFNGDISYTLASNFSIFSLFLTFSLILIYSNKPISFIIWALKSKKRIRENKSMKYNNYKQLRLKNIFISSITVIYCVLFAVFMLSDDTVNRSGGVIFAVLLFSVIIGSIFVARYIRKKKYSRQTNITLAIGGGLAYIFIFLVLVGILITFVTLDDYDRNKVPKDKFELVFSDFGYDENESDFYGGYQKSLLAERVHYSNRDENNSLSYTVLSSKYPWIVELQENRITEWVSGFEEDLKIRNTSLPSDIKVYSDEENEAYIFVTKNRVVDMHINLSRIDKDEFLDLVYEKLLKEN